jgi:hypothetical protein
MSKFKSIFDAAKERGTASAKQKTAEAKEATSLTTRHGRPTGNHSDPNFEQITAYIRKKLISEPR